MLLREASLRPSADLRFAKSIVRTIAIYCAKAIEHVFTFDTFIYDRVLSTVNIRTISLSDRSVPNSGQV